MRVCFIGDFSRNYDEGLKNIAIHLSEEISKYHEIIRFDIKKIFSLKNLLLIKDFDPDIIHYIPGPTFKSFLFSWLLGHYCKSKIVMSAPLPIISPIFKKLIFLFKPNLILVQSKKSEEMFNNLKIKNAFLTNGVDVQKFSQISKKNKRELREKFMLDSDKFTILHVGHLMKKRNLEIFTRLKNENNQVVIVASRHIMYEKNIYKKLNDAGCIIFDKYYKNIEEIYALSDCYIFPVKIGNTILTPLSVMEAMACNLLVITTKFEGLSALFKDDHGLFFVENEEEIILKLKNFKKNVQNINIREKVISYSWKNIGKKLNRIYLDL